MTLKLTVVERWPVLARHEKAAEWLQIWSDLGRAVRTIDAYGRGLSEFLTVCEREGVDPVAATKADVAVFVRDLTERPHRRGANVVVIDSGAGLSNATIQQRLVPVRLFFDFLVEEGCATRTRWAGADTCLAVSVAVPGAWCPGTRSCRGSRMSGSGSMCWQLPRMSRSATG